MARTAEVLPKDFEQRLASVGDLELDLARIYALGLSQVIITTHDVAQSLRCPQNTAGRHLAKLVALGFFTETLASTSGGGRGSGRKFRVVSPRLALARRMQDFEEFRENIGLIEEHLEIKAAEVPPSSDVWRVSSELMLRHMGRSCDSAVKSIKISCNDVSWVEEPEALVALAAAKKRGVRVTIFAADAPKGRKALLAIHGFRVRRTKGRSPVFLLVDDDLLYLPFKEGGIAGRYSALFTRNDYFVKGHKELFESLGGRE